MGNGSESTLDGARYRSLGLVANPFVVDGNRDTPGLKLEIAAEANRLLAAIAREARKEEPGSILVYKMNEYPEYYCRRANGRAEHDLIHDEGLNVLYAYIPFFTMRLGRIRATLLSLSERLAYRSFDVTLAAYLDRLLASPDPELPTYKAAVDAGLAEFVESLSARPLDAVASVFGEMVDERRAEMAGTPDTRLNRLPADVDESDDPAEVDATLGHAPLEPTMFDAEVLERLAGDKALEGTAPDDEASESDTPLLDYFLEYTRVHLSPVIARALSLYVSRGLDAMAYELRVTKAPRKTLAAIARFACVRFDKVVLTYDGFETWYAVPPDLKTSIVASLREIHETLAGYGFVVVMLEQGQAPELADAFGDGKVVRWEFPHLQRLGDVDAKVEPDYVSDWLDAASIDGVAQVDANLLVPAIESAEGDPELFTRIAWTAVELAADRAGSLEAGDVAAAIAAAGD